MQTLDALGPVLARYTGRGEMRVSNRSVSGDFEAAQLTNANILLLFRTQPNTADALFLFFGSQSSEPTIEASTCWSFEGKTTDGRHVRSQGEVHVREHHWATDASAAIFRLKELIVGPLNSLGEYSTVRYGITNVICPDEISLQIGDEAKKVSLRLRPVGTNADAKLRIEWLHAPDVATELFLLLPDKTNQLESDAIADSVCHILSVARGNSINCVYRIYEAPDGAEEARHHLARVTKMGSPLAPLEMNQVKEFVETAYPVFLRRRDRFELTKGTIAAYLEAKTTSDYLEMRGAKAAVAMEMLKLACKRGRKNEKFIEVLKDLVEEIDLAIADDELEKFKDSRNSLVHEGRFCSRQYSQGKQHNSVSWKHPFDEYLFLMDVLDRMFLRLLGYVGQYKNFYGQTKEITGRNAA